MGSLGIIVEEEGEVSIESFACRIVCIVGVAEKHIDDEAVRA